MKKLLLITVTLSFGFAQNTIQGTVTNELGMPLDQVLVKATPATLDVLTDDEGAFTIQVSEAQTLTFTKEGYDSFVVLVLVGDHVSIAMQPIGTEEYPYQNAQLAVVRLTDDEISDDNDAFDNISGVLQATKDVFLRTAAYEFSTSFFRLRGLDSDHANVLINGIPMNKHLNGRPQWSNWGGLNDVLRNQEHTPGIEPSDYLLGGVLGTTNINARASNYAKGGRVTLSSSDRSYAYRVLASYGTGLLRKGWSAAFALGARWGNSGFEDATFYEAQSLFFTIEKQWETHSLNATVIATPSRRGKSSPNTQEVYDLKGIRYNEYWGMQSGGARNSRVKRVQEPIVMLHHKWNFSSNSSLRTHVGFQFGEVGNSRLDYSRGANPSPAYYQKLPSYFLTQSSGPDYEDAYRFEQEFISNGQLDWNQLYKANLTLKEVGLPAAYVLYEDRTDDTQWTINSMLRTKINKNVTLNASLQYQGLTSRNFAELLDTLGSIGYLNVDSYNGFQYDLSQPNRVVRQGEKMQYHYVLHATLLDAFVNARFRYAGLSGYVAAGYSTTHYQRDGKFNHQAHPNQSFGKSKKLMFNGESFKAGAAYTLGRHTLRGNAAFLKRAPNMRNSFSNVRESNAVVGQQAGNPLTHKRIVSADISYLFRSPKVNARLTGFYTSIQDANEISFFFAEGIGGDTSSFVQEILYGIDKKQQGVEIGIEGKILPSLTLKGAAALGSYTYNNHPQVYLISNDFGYLDFGTAKMKNIKLASGPQQAYSVGVEFREQYWWFGVTANHFRETYLDISPINRTQNFLLDYDGLPFTTYDPEIAKKLLQQEVFAPYTVVNAVLGKSWRVDSRVVGAFLSVNNLFNTTYKTGGFEQSRNANYRELLDDVNGVKRRFGPKYWYGRGTTYFLNMYIRF